MGVSYVWTTIYLFTLWAPSSLQRSLAQNDSCSFSKSNFKLECFGSINSLGHEEDVKILDIRQFQFPALQIDDLLEDFPYVEEIIVSQSKINKIEGSFPTSNYIKVLNLTYLRIEALPGDFITPLRYLEVLDLRHNRLRSLEVDLVDNFSKIKHVYISENGWNCSLNLAWAKLLKNDTVRDIDFLQCHGRLYTDKPLLVIVAYIDKMKKNCLEKCDCHLVNVVRHPDSEVLKPIIQMNCSDIGLTALPKILPEHTKILILEKNNIQDLVPLINNPYYHSVWDLNLDDNSIYSISILEDSFWLTHFRLLSLRNNKLRQIPSFAFDNALQENINTPALQMFFAGNPWRCDCVFIPRFQELIKKYNRQFRDVNNIKCSYVEGDENSLLPIMQISKNDLCADPAEYTVQALDLLNCILASLIIFVLSKLAYDYYQFKKYGRLPWIVTKMP